MNLLPLIPVLTLAFAMDAGALTVDSDFEGASIRVIQIDQSSQTIRFMPGGVAERGWPCWWHFRITDVDVSKPLTLELHGSDAVRLQPGVSQNKPLDAAWAMPERASISLDGTTWMHSAPGTRKDNIMTYVLKSPPASLQAAWGPPYTPARAAEWIATMAEDHAEADTTPLCKSREGRAVPMLRIVEGDRVEPRRFGVWVQARQHAWESGASWVCQGVGEWLLSADPDAAWLRQNAEIYIVPIMDVDNTATGNGGKDALPQDHNRDWTPAPHWNEVAAAQKIITRLAAEGRMDVFLDLHNPAPGDRKAFFFALPREMLKPPMLENRDRFLAMAAKEISKAFPVLPQIKSTGPGYHPLWRQISGAWVTMNANPHTVALCLETPWNTPQSTTEGYRKVGGQLAVALYQYLSSQPGK